MPAAKPLKVTKIAGRRAIVSVKGKEKIVDASLIAGLEVGDYLLVHGDLAVNKLEKKDAEETLKSLSHLPD